MSTCEVLERGDPVADGRAFRRCLGQFATGVTVMTAQHDGACAGMVVNSFAAVSLDPALVLWSLRRESRNAALFTTASHFAVNVLASTQVEVAQQFATASGDKFAGLACSTGLGGAPLLDEAVAQFECRREALYDGGDHWILLGRVERYSRLAGEPLLFAQGRYAALREHPGLAPPPTTNAASGEAARQRDTFMRLLFRAGHTVSEAFEEERSAEGLTLSQARVIAWLYDGPRTLDELKRTIYLGARDAEDAVAELTRVRCVVERPGGILELTAEGRERRERIDARVALFEARMLEGISGHDVGVVRRVLSELAARTGALPQA